MLQLEDYAVTEAVAKNRIRLTEEEQVAKTKVKAEIDALELSHTPKDRKRYLRSFPIIYTCKNENQFTLRRTVKEDSNNKRSIKRSRTKL